HRARGDRRPRARRHRPSGRPHGDAYARGSPQDRPLPRRPLRQRPCSTGRVLMTLRTRKPTGQVAYPTIVIEGAEKVGKTYAALALSSSEKVGRTFVFDMGEGSADEYAALGPYEVVDHEGTFTDLLAQIKL